MVDRDGNVVVAAPWYGEVQTVGSAADWSALSWSWDAFAGPGVHLLKLAWVTKENRVMCYSYSEGRTFEIPCRLPKKSAGSPCWSPSGSFLAIDFRESDGGLLWVIEAKSGEVIWRGPYRGGWCWTASGQWIALGVPRSLSLGLDSLATCDLGFLDISDRDRRVTTAVYGDFQHRWIPLASVEAPFDLIAYYNEADEQDERSILWLEMPFLRPPDDPPPLPLNCDSARLADSLPPSLRESWTGEFAVHEDAGLLAVTCENNDHVPFIFVGLLGRDRWYLFGQGRSPAWSHYPPETDP